jgi:hypothetical protein
LWLPTLGGAFRAAPNLAPQNSAEIDYLNSHEVSVDEGLREANPLYAGWLALANDDKQKIVQSAAECILIGKGRSRDNPLTLAVL